MLEAGCYALGGPQKTIIKRIWNGVSGLCNCGSLQACFFLIMSLMLDKMRIYVVALKNFFYYSQRYQEKAVAPAASVHSCSMGKICLPWQCTLLVLKHRCFKNKMQSAKGGNRRNILLLTLND